MKKMSLIVLCLAAMSTIDGAPTTQNSALPNAAPLKIRVINFKRCAEESKLGKQEQASFEALKKQMEGVLSEKEKTINELASKFEDPDFVDSLSVEAETEMKRQFRSLNQEFSQLQQQYMQTLQQTNYKVVQKLSDLVGKASTNIGQRDKIDLILNDEVCFFANPSLDISDQIIVAINQLSDQEPEAEVKSGNPSKLQK